METTDKKPNAQKWTVEKVGKHLDAIETEAWRGYSLFLGSALAKRGLQRHVWSYWKRIFAYDDNILERMYVIDGIFEAKIFEAGLLGFVPARVAIQTLKLTYGWGRKDRQD